MYYQDDHNIFRFDVPMQHFFTMHVIHNFEHASGHKRWRLFIKQAPPRYLVIKLPVAAQFHEQVQILGVVEESVKLYYSRVI